MDKKDRDKEFELIYEGPADGSPDTLRKIKGCLIADLELSIAEVQQILDSAPLTIKRSDTEASLHVYMHALKNAGAKVLLVTPLEDPEPDSSSEEISEFSLNTDDAPELESAVPEVDLSAINDALSETENEPNQKVARSNIDLTDVKFELEDSSAVEAKSEPKAGLTPPTSPPLAPPTKTTDSHFELTLGDPEPITTHKPVIQHPIETPETPAKAAEPESFTISAVDPELSTPSPKTALPPKSPAAPPPNSAPRELAKSEPPPEPVPPAAHPTVGAKLSQISGRPVQTPQSEPEVDPNVEETQEIPLARVKSIAAILPKKTHFTKDILIAIVVGGVVLLGLNMSIFTNPKDSITEEEIDNLLANKPELKDFVRKHKADPSQAGPVEPKVYEIIGQTTTPTYKLHWNLMVDTDVLTTGRFELTTQAPPELTKEEIVNNKESTPWINRAVFEGLKFEKIGPEDYRSQLPARIYVEQGFKRNRVVAHAEIILHWAGKGEPINGSLKLVTDPNQSDIPLGLSIEVAAPDQYVLKLRLDFKQDPPQQDLPAASPETK